MTYCELCGEYLYADEEWRLTPGQIPGKEGAEDSNYKVRDGSGYVHKRCLE